MEYRAAGFWFDVGQFAYMVLVSVYVWWTNRSKATQKALTELKSANENLKHQIELLEHDFKHQPTDDEIGAIHQRVDQVGQGLTRVEGQLQQMNNNVMLIQQHLLRGAG